MVLAHLAERSLPTVEICSSNPAIGKNHTEHILLLTVEKTLMNKKEAGNGQVVTKVKVLSVIKTK